MEKLWGLKIVVVFMEKNHKLFGVPEIIVSDRDPIFVCNFWKEIFSCLGTQLAYISSYYPQSNWHTRIVKKFLESYICCFASNKETQFSNWFPLVEW